MSPAALASLPLGVGEVVSSGSLIIAIPLAILAGLVSFASPCVLPLVPAYLSYVTGLTGAEMAEARSGTAAVTAPAAAGSRAARAVRAVRAAHQLRCQQAPGCPPGTGS